MHILDTLRRPIITEKSTIMQESGRYSFEVATSATKLQIKQAVEEAFGVKVVKVNTMNVRGKRKRYGPRQVKQPDTKKAVVTLKPGNRINLIEGL